MRLSFHCISECQNTSVIKTTQYYSKSINFVHGTRKHKKTLKEINRIQKNYENIRKTHTILRNGSSSLP